MIAFVIGAVIGIVMGIGLMAMCQAAKTRDDLGRGPELIPITVAEPRMDSCCIIQASGKLQDNTTAHSAMLMAEYCEEGWIITEYPEAEDFTVEAWCYVPHAI